MDMKRILSIVGVTVGFSNFAIAAMPDCLSGVCVGRFFAARAGFVLVDENKCSGTQLYRKEENKIKIEVSVNNGGPLDKIPTGAVYSIERRIAFPDHMSIDDVITDFKVKYGNPDKEEIWKNRRGILMAYEHRSVLTKSVQVQSIEREISSTESVSYLQTTVDMMGRQAGCRSRQSIPD
jgi:hypothetical protein